MEIEEKLYYYKANFLTNYDGDTVTLKIDLGMKVFVEEKVRLFGLDTPEVNRKESKEAGLAARDFLRERLKEIEISHDRQLWVNTVRDKKGKYGRYLVVLYETDGNGPPMNLNDWLINSGHAVAKEY